MPARILPVLLISVAWCRPGLSQAAAPRSHHAGQDCLACHSGLKLGGTVFADGSGMSRMAGVPLQMLNTAGGVVLSSNAAGNVAASDVPDGSYLIQLGDISSIRMWKTHDCFAGLPVINRGFGGSHISDNICFADRLVLAYKPRLVVFYAGDNDVAAGKSAQRVLDDYRRFVRIVLVKLPETRIVFISIKPSESRWSLWPQAKEANELVRDLCREDDHLFYADLATPLLGPDGKPRNDLFLGDELHLNAAGYEIWTKALTPLLRKALASRDDPKSP
ncbi:MAG: hypothetical protein JW955_00500 [Sedimentisphaerales bacterium]|nr:hypothetical protein [Sedimentisphaerales bacterium]